MRPHVSHFFHARPQTVFGLIAIRHDNRLAMPRFLDCCPDSGTACSKVPETGTTASIVLNRRRRVAQITGVCFRAASKIESSGFAPTQNDPIQSSACSPAGEREASGGRAASFNLSFGALPHDHKKRLVGTPEAARAAHRARSQHGQNVFFNEVGM
jgi:hypothetical protein